MREEVKRTIILVSSVAVVALGWSAWAAPTAAPPPTSSSAEAEALAHFQKAEAHFQNEEWREAMEEYRKSLTLKKTKIAMAAAAECFRALGQYDDALDQYEELRRVFPVLPPKMEEKVAPRIADLMNLVGTLVVEGDAPEKAALFVDERRRGTLPLSPPLRLRIGSHTIRIEKEGFDPLSMTVEIKPGQANVAQVKAPLKMGRLRVQEKHGWALTVEVDGKDVGVAPWSSLVEAGEHRVRLHGFVGVEALASCEVPEVKPEAPSIAAKDVAKMGSNVEQAKVMFYEETSLVLAAEENDASLRIESEPKGASVKVDSKEVGRAPWEGRLSLEEHRIEVSAQGYVSATKIVRLERRKQRELSVSLEREPDREAELRAARNAKIGYGVAYGAGAVGLGVFAVTGGLALHKVSELRASCPTLQCPPTQAANLTDTSTLGTAATVGIVVAGLGAAAGTAVLLLTRPQARARPASASVSASVGLGSAAIQGRF